MSTNIHIRAVREIIVKKTGRIELQYEFFNCEQTPTEDTEKIMSSANRLEAYEDWLYDRFNYEEREHIYDDDDYWCEGDPIGVKVRHVGQSLVSQLREWVASVEERGYDVEVHAQ